MKKTACILLIAFTLTGCNHEKKEQAIGGKLHAELNYTLTKKIDNAYEMGLLKGFSVAIVDEDNILYTNGFGYRHIDTTQSYTSSTIQPISSISKTLIEIALIKAVELDLLQLDDPINDHLPFKVLNLNQEILIEHLAYHTSSIIDTQELYLSAYFMENDTVGSDEGATIFLY